MKKKTTEQVICEVEMKRGDHLFDFSEMEYKDIHTPVVIRCKVCNHKWRPSISNLLRGTGCPQCARSLTFGVGIKDISTPTGDVKYHLWQEMLKRCYYEPHLKKEPSYRECTVCDEWLTFSNFKKWLDKNYIEGYQLDKDILFKGNKVYSPDTCCFVPKNINVLFTLRSRQRGDAPIGATLRRDGYYQVRINKYGKNYHIGCYKTPEEAFNAYKIAKEAYIKEVATDYYNRGEITKRVYDALMAYEIEITD